MNATLLWLGILPVVIFVVLESFAGKKSALVAAIGMALFEVAFSLIVYHTIDELTVLAFILVAVLGVISVQKDNDLYFKLQPAILGIILSATLFVFYYILDEPLLVVMFKKYFPDGNPMSGQLAPEIIDGYLMHLSKNLWIWLLVHALATGFAAMKLSKWWWFVFRVPGFYVTMFAAAFFALKSVMIK